MVSPDQTQISGVTAEQHNRRLSRLSLIQALVNKARDNNESIPFDEFVSMLCLRWGSSRRTVLEYLDILRTSNLLVHVNGKIYHPFTYKRLEELK